jgi:hypothetical protein
MSRLAYTWPTNEIAPVIVEFRFAHLNRVSMLLLRVHKIPARNLMLLLRGSKLYTTQYLPTVTSCLSHLSELKDILSIYALS